METVCQPSYPLNSENASPFGTRTVYLAWAVSCAEMALPPKTASTETASETTTITTAGTLLRFIATSPWFWLLACELGFSLGPTAAELVRVKRHELADAHRRPAGHPLHAVRQPVIPTPPVQLGHRQQMLGQVLRYPRLLQLTFPILGGNVGVFDLTVDRIRVLPGGPVHVP